MFLEQLEGRHLMAGVVTDQLDYPPGATAQIFATDFQIGEAVKFQVLHNDGIPNTGNGHEPWTVTDGGPGDLDGLVNGNIHTTWYVDPDDSLGSTFELSALGLSSGLYDTHVFTDGPPSPGQLNQWDPGNAPNKDWVSGNNDGPYFEGDVVPYYITLDDLIVGNVYQVTIGFDTTKSGKRAFDYLETYDETIAFPPAVDPAVDAGLIADPTPDLLPIPLDPDVPLGIQQPGDFTMYYGDMTGTSAYALAGTGTYAGDSTRTITITFTAQDDGVGDATTNVVLIWGGHIATRQDWGPDSSAVSISGSPYHMRLISFFDVTDPNDPDDLGGGNQDRSLSASAVIFPATITIIKDAIPNNAQDFAFTTTGTGLSNFSLDDDGDNTNTLSNSQVFSVTEFGAKTITEAIVAGWNLTGIQILESGGLNDSTFNVATRQVTLNVQEGESITITFTNELQAGSITVIKDALPNGPQDFSFSGDLGVFSLDDDADGTLPSSRPFSNLTPGTYIVTEAALAGWDLTNLVINDPDNGSSIDLATRTATLDVDPGETLTVTFTNTQRGSITVIKDALPNGPQDFSFSGDLGVFSLDDDADGTLPSSRPFSNLTPGTYIVTEAALAGWDLTNLVINDPDNGSSIDLATRTATLDVDAGETLTVTFTNTQRGSITVIKDALPNGPQDFSFSGDLGVFSLDDDADGTLPSSRPFSNLTPGTYIVTEAALAGWDLTNLVINDPDNGSSIDLATRTATLDVDAGETLTVTFTNTQRGSITVIKDALPNGPQDFSFSGDLGVFSLDDDADGTLPSSRPFSNLTPGTYIVTEAALAGWDLTNLVINDPDNGSSIDLATRTATLDVDAGETLTVTFTNTQRGSITVIKDALPNGPQDFSFSGDLGVFSLDDDADGTLPSSRPFSNLTPGTYIVTEAALAGWDLTNLVINDPDNGSSIDLATRTATLDVDAGETLTVTFTNTQRGSITVIKDALPNGPQDFSFSGDLGVFSLDDDADGTLPSSRPFSNLTPGTYIVTEAALAGWDLTNLVINDPDNGSSIDLATRTATLDVDAGETLTVTFTNTQRGSITVIKDALPNGPQDFSFSGDLGVFSLDDDADGTLPSSRPFSNLTPGTYIVTEAALAGWDLTNLVINDPDNGSSIDLATRTATLDVDAGETLTVTFTNTQRGSITVIKDALPNGPQDFSFSGDLGVFSLDDDADGTLPSSRPFSNLTPGTYIVTEAALAGWDLTNLVINDPDNGSSIDLATRTATLDVDAGETLTVTFTNTQRGSITVIKDALPNGPQDFSFSGDLGVFSLDDDADGTLPSSRPFSNLTPGTYIVTEAALAGWDLTNLVINDPDNGSSIDLATRTATLDVDAGETLTVTFTNTQRGSITVIKDALPNGPQDFSFSGDLGVFSLDDDADGTLPSSRPFSNLTPGTYIVTEAALAGWDLTNLVINDPDNGSSIDLATRTATLDVDAGETLTVTFTNTQRGSITVIKDALPNGPQDFSFSGDLGVFSLDDDADGTLPSSRPFSNLTPGTYIVTEAALAGWDLTNLVINDPDNGSSIDLATRTATLDVDAGETLTVTFTNTQRGSITVIKDALPNGPQDFSFSGDLGVFSLDDDADGTLPSSRPFSNLTPGTYIVTEAALAGWDLTNLVINDPDNGSSIDLATRTATLDVDAGETLTVTFTNTQRGSITVIKDALPNGPQDFSFSGDLGVFSLDDDADGTLPSSRPFSNLTPGTYIVTEAALAGWDLTNLVINDPDNGSSIDLATRTATLDVDAGETLTVTFTNTQRGSITVIKDALPNGPQDFSFSGDLGVFSLDDDADGTLPSSRPFSNLTPGTYIVTEAALAGWDLTNLVINDPDNGSSIDLATRTATLDVDAGETLTVTFTNTQDATVVLQKRTFGGDAEFEFAVEGDLAGQGIPAGVNLTTAGGFGQTAVFTFSNLPAGGRSLTLAERIILAGWDLTSVEIFGGDDDDVVSVGTQAELNVEPGEVILVRFTNTQRGSIAWEKRREPDNALQGGATFTITPNPLTGAGSLVVLDDGPLDFNKIPGQFLVPGALPRAGDAYYTVTETVAPAGYYLDDDTTRVVTVAAGESAVIGVQGLDNPGNTDESDFHNSPIVVVVVPDKANRSLPFVHLVNAVTGEFVSRFLAYGINYRGGVRVATGDITGDGIPEIITAPGRNLAPVIKVFTQDGTLLEQFLAYETTFTGGVDLAIGDVNNDGQNDIITAMSYNGNVVKVFKNPNGILDTAPTPYHAAYNFGTNSTVATSIVKFSPYGATFKGGASVEVADMGTVVGAATKSLNTTLDNKLELIVANESGMRSTVYVYGFSPALTAATITATPHRVRTYLPFSSTFRGGMSLAVAPVAHTGQDLIPDIIVGAGNGGASQVQILNGATTSTVILKGFQGFTAADTTSFNAPIRVTAFDQDGDANGIAETVLVSQGTDGTAGRIRKFSTLNAALVDQLMESQFDPNPTIDDFLGAYFTTTLKVKRKIGVQ